MPDGWKLQHQAKDKGITERALLISALETSRNYAEAGVKLGMTAAGIKAAVRRYGINVERKMVLA